MRDNADQNNSEYRHVSIDIAKFFKPWIHPAVAEIFIYL